MKEIFIDSLNFNYNCISTEDIDDWESKYFIFYNSKNGNEVKIYTPLQKTGFGRRFLLVCPRCEKRYMILFDINDINDFACRNCLGLKYHSNTTRNLRLYNFKINNIIKKNKIEDLMPFKYFGQPVNSTWLNKPKYMREKKWSKIRKELSVLFDLKLKYLKETLRKSKR